MFDFISVALKNLFIRPATRNYPKTVREPFAGQRGHIENRISACIFCGICSRKCPVSAIKIERDKRTWAIDRFQCIVCGECAASCPKKCLSVLPAYTAPATHKTVDVSVFAQEENEAENPPFHPRTEPAAKPVLRAVPSIKNNEPDIAEEPVRQPARHSGT